MDLEALLTKVIGPPLPLEGAKPSQMIRQEQLIALGLTAATLLAGISVLALSTPAIIPLLAVACGASVLGIRRGHRILSGALLVLAGAVAFYATSPYLVIPHYGFAMYVIVFRMNKQVKVEQQAKAAERAATRAAQGGRAPGGKPGKGAKAGPIGPGASKRYTPPQKKKPKPVVETRAKVVPDDAKPEAKSRFGRRPKADA